MRILINVYIYIICWMYVRILINGFILPLCNIDYRCMATLQDKYTRRWFPVSNAQGFHCA